MHLLVPLFLSLYLVRASSFLPHSSPPLIFLIFSFHTLSVTVGKVRAKESKNLQKSKRDLVLFLYSFSPLFSFEHPLYQTLGMKAEDWRASFRTTKNRTPFASSGSVICNLDSERRSAGEFRKGLPKDRRYQNFLCPPPPRSPAE